jgi:hypothetical protein
LGTKIFSHSANLQAAISTAGFLQVPPKSSFKKLLLGTGLWHHAKMSTSLKFLDGLKDAECKKVSLAAYSVHPRGRHCLAQGRSSGLQIKLPYASHLRMLIYSRGNNEEYLAHIVAVLQVIEQKRLPKKCRVLAKAVARWSKALNNLQDAAES